MIVSNFSHISKKDGLLHSILDFIFWASKSIKNWRSFLSFVIYIDAFYKIAFLDLSIIYSDNYGSSFPYLDE